MEPAKSTRPGPENLSVEKRAPARERTRAFWLANLCLGGWFAALIWGVALGGAIHLLLLVGGFQFWRLTRDEGSSNSQA